MTKVQASHLTGQTQIWAKPKTPITTEEITNRLVAEMLSLFCWFNEIALAKVKLLRSEVFAIAKVKFVLRTSEVKFAHHFAVRRNFTHEVNFTIEDNFTCPNGQT